MEITPKLPNLVTRFLRQVKQTIPGQGKGRGRVGGPGGEYEYLGQFTQSDRLCRTKQFS
jgi:hypothetical protein